ncbi:MAG: PQQ-binding-like beta-propeller repeat protein [Halobacteriota archaeon]
MPVTALAAGAGDNYTTKGTVHSSPTVANGIVYVGSWDHNVYALKAATNTSASRKQITITRLHKEAETIYEKLQCSNGSSTSLRYLPSNNLF